MTSSYVCKHTGDGSDGNLSKVQFARIVDGKLVYDDGKHDHYVFGGMTKNLMHLHNQYI